MHGPHLHTDRFGGSHADEQVFEHRAVLRHDTKTRGSQQVDVRPIFADVAGIVHADDLIEIVEDSNVPHGRFTQCWRKRSGNGQSSTAIAQLP